MPEESRSRSVPKTHNPARRKLLQSISVLGAVSTSYSVPDKWLAPVVDSIVVPPHAGTSPDPTRGLPRGNCTTDSITGNILVVPPGGPSCASATEMLANETVTVTYNIGIPNQVVGGRWIRQAGWTAGQVGTEQGNFDQDPPPLETGADGMLVFQAPFPGGAIDRCLELQLSVDGEFCQTGLFYVGITGSTGGTGATGSTGSTGSTGATGAGP